ncbi:MAG: HAMP domain-containing sensor histidine kinase [Clostridiales bacterium]|nr:HAMP domain-containing sensor histidine kinase [Clostridiales bacterium]
MRYIKLRTKITLISAIILIVLACTLTLISVKSAKKTYTNEFEMSISDGLSFKLNDKKIELGSKGSSNLGDILDFAGEVVKSLDKDSSDLTKSDSKKISVNQIFNNASNEFTKNSIIIMSALVILGIVIIYKSVGYALKPVRQLSKSMETINANNLCQKLEEPTSQDEIGSLTNSFNHLLGRLNETFESQKNFTANAAHELKTPLATMKAGIQVLEMEESPSIEEYKETVEVAKANTERLIHIVEDLTNLTKQENLHFTDSIDLADTIEDCLKELEPISKQRNVTLQEGDCEGVILGNQTLISRALFNLLENAVKYNRDNGYVYVTSKKEGDQIKVVIEDNGIGIPKEALPQIFEPFYRVDKSRSREIGDSGLGLALVRNIIEKHHGTISVRSCLGQGTTFEVVFNKEV